MKEIRQKIIGNIIVALILAAAGIFSCFIGVKGLADYKEKRNDIDIRGYSKQQIVSDLIVWTGFYDVQAANLKDGYSLLETDRDKVKNYLVQQGFKEEDLIFSSISINENHVLNEYGGWTNEIQDYGLSQTVTISSDQIDKVTEVSRNSTDLLNEGVQFQSYAPEYHYTKLDELKVTMLADATKDATKRAQMIAENAGSKLGHLAEAHITSTKVTPLYSIPEDYYDEYGYDNNVDNDTVSLEKEVTVTVYCTFEIDN